jgi:outer membrane protein OmpA-like peptidoglycan-associated protein
VPRNRGMTLLETVILVGVVVLFLYLAFGSSSPASAQSNVDIDPRVPIFTTGVTLGPWTGGSSWPHTGVGFGIHQYDRSDDGTVSKFMDWRALQAHRAHAAAVALVESLSFAFDSAEIAQHHESDLDFVARILAENPEVSLTLAGHTDLAGPGEYNDVLADRRADAVRDALIERGVSEDRLGTAGFGESRPLEMILGPSDMNRRVEVQPSLDLP